MGASDVKDQLEAAQEYAALLEAQIARMNESNNYRHFALVSWATGSTSLRCLICRSQDEEWDYHNFPHNATGLMDFLNIADLHMEDRHS